MPGLNAPGGVPPEMPPEYAEAYRAGFERAYAERTGALPELDESLDSQDQHTRAGSMMAGLRTSVADADRNRYVVPAVLAVIALLLILGAYALGKVFSGQVSGADVTSEEPADGVVLGEGATDGASEAGNPKDEKDEGKKAGKEKQGKPYQGAVHSVAIGGGSASCTSTGSVDAAGKPVSYEVGNAYDGRAVTAWRCDGNGVGEQVTLQLPGKTKIGEVGLIPGYAKTDPVDGSDRYAENNRITRVRWVFDDGTSVTQKLDGSPGNRALQTKRIPPTTTSSVTIEILASTPGPRNTVAISEVELGSVS